MGKQLLRIKKAMGSMGIMPGVQPNLAHLANLINAIHGQFHDIHFKANDTNVENKGHWDNLHAILGEYYERLYSDYDPTVEWAIASGLDTTATNNSAAAIGYTTTERSVFEGYQYEEALRLVHDNLTLMCDVAALICNKFEDNALGIAIKNYLGNFLQHWAFELNYRIERRLKS